MPQTPPAAQRVILLHTNHPPVVMEQAVCILDRSTPPDKRIKNWWAVRVYQDESGIVVAMTLTTPSQLAPIHRLFHRHTATTQVDIEISAFASSDDQILPPGYGPSSNLRGYAIAQTRGDLNERLTDVWGLLP